MTELDDILDRKVKEAIIELVVNTKEISDYLKNICIVLDEIKMRLNPQ